MVIIDTIAGIQDLLSPGDLLIDGGAGQVGAVAGILAELGVTDIDIVGVAKGIDRDAGKEEFHRIGARPMALRRGDPVLYFIQRMRDEAHRFAITGHRQRREKQRKQKLRGQKVTPCKKQEPVVIYLPTVQFGADRAYE